MENDTLRLILLYSIENWYEGEDKDHDGDDCEDGVPSSPSSPSSFTPSSAHLSGHHKPEHRDMK